jgi:hypothetical protein
MSNTKTTLISHVFNEEYLLPFWLTHHKPLFDEIIIVDYNSTDKSIEICKSICPNCIIKKTRNCNFSADDVDNEIMDIENDIDGIKIVLNTTEFIFSEIPIKDLFINNNTISYSVNQLSAYSNNINICNNPSYSEYFKNLLNDDCVYHYDRGVRQLHNYPNGNYTIGRHTTQNPHNVVTNKAHIIWLGFYPINDNLMKRKLQIQQHIPQSDRIKGWGFQHLWDTQKILSVNIAKAKNGIILKDINLDLYNLLCKYITALTM